MKIIVEFNTANPAELSLLKKILDIDNVVSYKDSLSVEELNIPIQVQHSLIDGGIYSINDLKKAIADGGYYKLTKIRNIGVRATLKIEAALKEYGK